ncbi:monosaccharide ABC transporter membrane protein, CUT2 family (TC 3.A.1.2.-) [Devosia enhydra]|uniref:Autoinducer 2 import system permease protein LsrD n=1 Tax=Devosia enhydra TaxID=665118 RepID=A0A1K2HX09_9HYPH|nr:monosaccharide ABC transporter membrane protein, CUT2 family (TC 3.A.1.2.-) [Devosia enhydra]
MNRLRSTLTDPLVLATLSILVLLAAGEALSPGFARGDQIVRLLVVSAILGLVAAGQSLVVIGGREGIDLSVGASISLGAVLAGNVMAGQDGSIFLAVLVAGGATFLIGLINGLGVTMLRIPPLVMTLGMTGVVQGALIVISRGIPSGNAAPALMAFVNRPLVFGLPGILILWALVGVLMWVLLRRTRLGYAIYAIGSNERAAELTGLPVRAIRTLLYGLSGLFAGLTGVIVIGYTGNSFVSVGDQYVLPSVIAVVIGGISLAGGQGNYFGAMLGAIALTLLTSVLTTLQLEFWGRQLIFGAVLLMLMLLYGRAGRLRA